MSPSETCPNGHEMTPENRYVTQLLQRVRCKACIHERNLARVHVSKRKAPKAPIDPAVVAQLRDAAGIPTTKGRPLIRIDTAELVALLTDLVHTAGDPEAGAVGGVLLHTDRGYSGVEPGRTSLLVGTSTNRFAVGHTYTTCSGTLAPTLWPVQDVKAVVAVLKPLAKDDHGVEIRTEDDGVVISEDPDMFGNGLTLTFNAGNLTKYPRQIWGVLGDVHVTVKDATDAVILPRPRTDIAPAVLAPFIKIASRRKAPLEVYRYHQRRPLLVQIGTAYRGAINPMFWADDVTVDIGSAPAADIYAPELPEVDDAAS